jgi:hypothetical protein
MTCGLLHSSLLFPTIACPRVCWGGGLIHYQAVPGDAFALCARARLNRGVRLLVQRKEST